jgi:hypothetical protein
MGQDAIGTVQQLLQSRRGEEMKTELREVLTACRATMEEQVLRWQLCEVPAKAVEYMAVIERIDRLMTEPAGEPWGTLEGAERYLEARDREAFMILRRETNWISMNGQDPKRYRFIQDLESFWIGYAEAWGHVHKLLQPHPKYKHDCENCVFLGRCDVLASQRDLYFCKQAGTLPTVIARYSDEPSDFTSGLGSRMYELIEAEKRARDAGLLPTREKLGLRLQQDEDWPWCEACHSYHHPNNPTCVLKAAEKR